MSVTITVDGKKIEAPEGSLLIDVCRHNGIKIPHFCYHPGLGPDGNCRMCQVEFVSERGNRLGISCNAVVADGMEILTQSEAVLAARKSVEEMLLLNHPLDCPICDKAGECTLQDYYMAHDLQNSRMEFERFRKSKAVDIGPTLVLDQQRCVLCDRCVRFLRNVAGEEQLFIAGRAHEAYVTTFPGKQVTSPYSLNTVDICPVGALTAKDFRFASPTWYLKRTPSVCTTCARGCSTEIHSRKGRIHRIRPRFNPEVNGYWMCDEGRLNYKFVNEDRIAGPQTKRGSEKIDISFEEARAEMLRLLGCQPGGAKAGAEVKSAVLVSATCTLEEMFLAKHLAVDLLKAPVFVVRHVADGVEDDILRKSDRHPNTKGAELLGITTLGLAGGLDESAANLLGEARSPGGTLLCVGFNRGVSEALEAVAAKASAVVAISACRTSLSDRADLVVPGLTFAEKDGLLVNFEGQVQRLGVALDGKPEFPRTAMLMENAPRPQSDWALLDDLTATIGGGEPAGSIERVRKLIAEKEPAFAGVDLANIGRRGVHVSGQPVES